MDAAKLEALKAHCHIDFDDDNAKLVYLYGVAVDYLAGAGVTCTERNSPGEFAAFSLVNEWYDGQPVGTCTIGLRQVINQLKMRQVADSGTGF